jgi:hypothetical protein
VLVRQKVCFLCVFVWEFLFLCVVVYDLLLYFYFLFFIFYFIFFFFPGKPALIKFAWLFGLNTFFFCLSFYWLHLLVGIFINLVFLYFFLFCRWFSASLWFLHEFMLFFSLIFKFFFSLVESYIVVPPTCSFYFFYFFYSWILCFYCLYLLFFCFWCVGCCSLRPGHESCPGTRIVPWGKKCECDLEIFTFFFFFFPLISCFPVIIRVK